jgi:methionyl-tRNA formyltransferase
MARKQVVLIGSIPLATLVLRRLLDNPKAEVVGVVCEPVPQAHHDAFSAPPVCDEARSRGLPISDIPTILKEYPEGSFDLGFSCRAPYILSRAFLARFRKGVVNFHGGPLPELRGLHAANHAVRLGFTKSAGTLHFMDEGIDTGPILHREEFPIAVEDTAYDVFLKTQHALLRAFDHSIDALLEDRESVRPQEAFIAEGSQARYHQRGDLDRFRPVPLDAAPLDLLRLTRAFDFPGHVRAYLVIDGHRVYLTTKPRYSDD